MRSCSCSAGLPCACIPVKDHNRQLTLYAFFPLIPPSSSIQGFTPASSHICRSLRTFSTWYSMNFWPPNPGFTAHTNHYTATETWQPVTSQCTVVLLVFTLCLPPWSTLLVLDLAHHLDYCQDDCGKEGNHRISNKAAANTMHKAKRCGRCTSTVL